MSTRYRDNAGQARFPTPRDAPELLIDPLTKPVDFVDLSALTEALTRCPDTELRVGPLELDLIERTAKRGDRSIELLPREFHLLKYMMRHKDRVLTREMLLAEVWRYKRVPKTNLVDVHMGRLRRKINGPHESPMILNVPRKGFILRGEDGH